MQKYPLKELLKLSGLARSTYYYYLKQPNTDKYECEKQEIQEIYNTNKGRYGYRRITIAMRNKGYVINHKTVQKLMKQLGLKGKQRKNEKYHSDQGWQYQHAEFQRLVAEHNITQSMSRKGNCMDNGTMENFFGRLKVEMFYGEKFESVNAFIDELKNYIDYYNSERISLKLKGMSPVQYRTHSLAI